MADEPTLYEILGVAKDAAPEEVRRAYRAASKTAHPDAGGSPGLFLMVLHAYEILSDPTQRALYDSGVKVRDDKQQEIDDLKEKLRTQHTQSPKPATQQVPMVGPELPSPTHQVVVQEPKQRISLMRKIRVHWEHWFAHCLALASGPAVWSATGIVFPESWDTSSKVSPALASALRFLFPRDPAPAIALVLCVAFYFCSYTYNAPKHIRVFAPIIRWSLLGAYWSLAALFFALSSPIAYILCGVCISATTSYGFVWRRYVRHQDAGLKL